MIKLDSPGIRYGWGLGYTTNYIVAVGDVEELSRYSKQVAARTSFRIVCNKIAITIL